MRGKARICVATVAFGLGIDKADIVGIVHMYLSSSPEHYIQEIGRAGRDGRAARAIALPTIEEVPLRHSLVHSNYISKSQIRSLLLFMKEAVTGVPLKGDERSLHIALPVQASVLGCDCKAETIETLLSMMEQNGGNDPLLYVEGFNYDLATIALKKRSLKKLAEKEEVAACIQEVGVCCDPPVGEGGDEEKMYTPPGSSFQRQFLAYSRGSYTFSVAKCANKLGKSAEPRHVFAALRRLQSSNELELALDTTDKGRVFHVKLSATGVSFFGSNNFNVLAEKLTSNLHEAFCATVDSGADKVLDIHYIMDEMATASNESINSKNATLLSEKSPCLVRFQQLASDYFQEGLTEKRSQEASRLLPPTFLKIRKNGLEIDISSLMRDLPSLLKQASNSENGTTLGDPAVADYTALVLTKFLHGVDSPRAPMRTFRTHPLFGKWREVRFLSILEYVHSLLAPTERPGSHLGS
jgi:hypothetical protein